MRLLFFGSGAFGLPTLEALHERHEVVAVVSQPDRPAGRKRGMTPTPVAAWALDAGLPVWRSEDVNEPDFVQRVREAGVEASVVIAFGQKLSPGLIDAMGGLAVNLHASLLPAYRGAAPIQRAMLDNVAETGVSVIGLAQRMDAGAVYATARTPIDPAETAGELHDRLAELGPGVILDVLERQAAGALDPQTQDEALATRAPKFSKADGTTGFDMAARRVRARVHGLTPWPGCRVRYAGASGLGELILRRVEAVERSHDAAPGTVLADLSVACGEGALRLIEVQVPGGRPLSFEEFRRGHPFAAGDRLTALI